MSRLAPSARGVAPRTVACRHRANDSSKSSERKTGRRPWRRWPRRRHCTPTPCANTSNTLVRTGLATRTREQPHGRGRPAWTYEATSALTEASEYAALSVVLSSTIARTSANPRADAEIAGEDWGRDLARRRGALPDDPGVGPRPNDGPSRRPRLRDPSGRVRAVDGPPHTVPVSRGCAQQPAHRVQRPPRHAARRVARVRNRPDRVRPGPVRRTRCLHRHCSAR